MIIYSISKQNFVECDSCGANTKCIYNQNTTEVFCKCKTGFERNVEAPISTDCTDLDECQNPNICDQYEDCVNSVGSYECKCRAGYEKKGDKCELCVVGFFNDGSSDQCEVCGINKYTNRTNPVACGECEKGSQCENGLVVQCALGYFEVDGGDVMCNRCPFGHFCHSGLKFECPDGSYTPIRGRWTIFHCKKCPVNHYCPPGILEVICRV